MSRRPGSPLVTAAVSAILLAGMASASANDSSRPGKRPARPHQHLGSLELAVLGTYSTGLGSASAEIVAFDPRTARLFVSNAATNTVDIVDARDPSRPVKRSSIDVSVFGVPNSVAVSRNLVAVAIEAVPKTDIGHVAFYKTNGEFINAVRVGVQPDMLTFTPDASICSRPMKASRAVMVKGSSIPKARSASSRSAMGSDISRSSRTATSVRQTSSVTSARRQRFARKGFASMDQDRTPRRISSPSTSRYLPTRARRTSPCRKTTRSPRSTSQRPGSTRSCRWGTRTTVSALTQRAPMNGPPCRWRE